MPITVENRYAQISNFAGYCFASFFLSLFIIGMVALMAPFGALEENEEEFLDQNSPILTSNRTLQNVTEFEDPIPDETLGAAAVFPIYVGFTAIVALSAIIVLFAAYNAYASSDDDRVEEEDDDQTEGGVKMKDEQDSVDDKFESRLYQQDLGELGYSDLVEVQGG